MNTKTRLNGFSLIEVMIAVLVLSVGILAVAKLQTSLIKSGSNSNERSVAASIVHKKINDLGRFIYVNSVDSWSDLAIDTDTGLKYPGSLSFENIANNEGGRIRPVPTYVGNINYTLSWSVIDYYYSGVNSPATTTAVTTYPAFKLAHVVATWDGVDTNNVVSFDTAIYAYNPALTAVSDTISTGNDGPTDKIDDNFDFDNSAAELDIEDGNKQIGGQVAPNISRAGASNVVAFESIVFNTSTNAVQRRDRFSTVGCVCKSNGATPATQHLTGYVTWDSASNTLSDSIQLTSYTANHTLLKENGLGDNDQAFECNACCRDGKNEVPTATINVAYKLCRFKYIAGGLKIYPDWKLIGFNVIPENFLNTSTNDAIYSNYVTSLIRTVAEIEKTQGNTFFLNTYSNIDNTFVTYASSQISAGGYNQATDGTSNLQLQARAIYMDEIPDGGYEGTTYTATNIPLDRIPFYEVDLTKLVGWAADEDNLTFTATYTGDHVNSGPGDWNSGLHDPIPNGAGTPCQGTTVGANCVSNQELIDGSEGTYSRGLFYADISSPTTVVRSQILTGNDGWLDRDVNSETLNTTSISITVTP